MWEKRNWNRSAAFEPEELATLNSRANEAVAISAADFERVIAPLSLTDAQRMEAYGLFTKAVSDGLEKSVQNIQHACTL